MKNPALMLSAVALGLSGCATYAPAPGPYAGPITVTTATKAPFGAYLVDGGGRSLYILEGTRGETGTSRCTPDCLRVWPPLHGGTATAGAGVNPALLATTPLHGEPHVTYSGWPLYHYTRDAAPGDTTGQNVTDRWGTWHLIAPSGVPIRPAGASY